MNVAEVPLNVDARTKGILIGSAALELGGMISPANGPLVMVPSCDVVAATDWLVCDPGKRDTVLVLLVLLFGDVSGGVVGGVGAARVPGVGSALTDDAAGAAAVVGGVVKVLVPGVGLGVTDAGGGACTLCLGCHRLGSAAGGGDTGVALLVGSCGGVTDFERGGGRAGGTFAVGGVGFLEEVRSTTSCRGLNVMAWNGHESQV